MQGAVNDRSAPCTLLVFQSCESSCAKNSRELFMVMGGKSFSYNVYWLGAMVSLVLRCSCVGVYML